MSWDQSRVERLKTLWADGLSCSEIAAELGGVTRNAIIGKVHRLGLSGRVKVRTPRAARIPRPRKPQLARAARMRRAAMGEFADPLTAAGIEAEPLPEFDDSQIPVEQRRTLLQLTDETCRYPVGDPHDAGFFFCGAQTFEDSPYCADHACRVGAGFGKRPVSSSWIGRHA
jgi:GcrA cell cycle regulator